MTNKPSKESYTSVMKKEETDLKLSDSVRSSKKVMEMRTHIPTLQSEIRGRRQGGRHA